MIAESRSSSPGGRWRLARRPLLFAVVLAAAGVGAAGGYRLARPVERNDHRPHETVGFRQARLSSLSTRMLGELRESPDRIRGLFEKCRAELRADLGGLSEDLEEEELQYVFCTIVAHALAPYGPSTCTRYEDLLKARSLHCGNYGLLVYYLARSCRGGKEGRCRLRFVGWHGGVVGNHQMLFLSRSDGSQTLVLDPTVGLVAHADFDTVASGRPVDPERIVLFGVRDEPEPLRRRVVRALATGGFKPSDLLYYFDGIEHFTQRYGDPNQWPTPARLRL